MKGITGTLRNKALWVLVWLIRVPAKCSNCLACLTWKESTFTFALRSHGCEQKPLQLRYQHQENCSCK